MDSFLNQKLSSISFIRTESSSDKIHRSSRDLLQMCLKKNELVSKTKIRRDPTGQGMRTGRLECGLFKRDTEDMKYKIIIMGLTFLSLSFSGLSATAHISEEEALQKTAREIYSLVMCPLCAGQTIGQSSNETSRQMRELVLKKLRQGETKEEILQYFESRYGERILAKPNKKRFNLIL